ncbi:hypothetical protein BC781_102253 [Sediminitomix flava]|uniref:Uncharacterized protein n=1 Tax=Sediminitomix flava TaxID=379075 RepID=A0A315ZCZ5_SEDFL|nr:hypothetical protein BC781_102253 [Sediminitomix flava]
MSTQIQKIIQCRLVMIFLRHLVLTKIQKRIIIQLNLMKINDLILKKGEIKKPRQHCTFPREVF